MMVVGEPLVRDLSRARRRARELDSRLWVLYDTCTALPALVTKRERSSPRASAAAGAIFTSRFGSIFDFWGGKKKAVFGSKNSRNGCAMIRRLDRYHLCVV